MKQYLDLLRQVLDEGERRPNRTGTDTIGIFGAQMRFPLREGFPLVTTKKLHWKSIAHELLWFIAGDTNVNTLKEKGVNIWNKWAAPDGSLGPVYGHQWRFWGAESSERHQLVGPESELTEKGIDQLASVVTQIKATPDSRRLVVSAWNPDDIPVMALPPCHCLFQFYVQHGRLSCQLYQRSADMFLGIPFNIASYALLTHMVARECGLKVGDFIHTLGDAHIYVNHVNQVREQLTRVPLELPDLVFREGAPLSIFDLKYEDFALTSYTHYEPLPGEVAV